MINNICFLWWRCNLCHNIYSSFIIFYNNMLYNSIIYNKRIFKFEKMFIFFFIYNSFNHVFTMRFIIILNIKSKHYITELLWFKIKEIWTVYKNQTKNNQIMNSKFWHKVNGKRKYKNINII